MLHMMTVVMTMMIRLRCGIGQPTLTQQSATQQHTHTAAHARSRTQRQHVKDEAFLSSPPPPHRNQRDDVCADQTRVDRLFTAATPTTSSQPKRRHVRRSDKG